MNIPEDLVVTEMDEILKRSESRVEQHRIRTATLTGQQALLAEGVLSEMLASIGRLTQYRANLTEVARQAHDPTPNRQRR